MGNHYQRWRWIPSHMTSSEARPQHKYATLLPSKPPNFTSYTRQISKISAQSFAASSLVRRSLILSPKKLTTSPGNGQHPSFHQRPCCFFIDLEANYPPDKLEGRRGCTSVTMGPSLRRSWFILEHRVRRWLIGTWPWQRSASIWPRLSCCHQIHCSQNFHS